MKMKFPNLNDPQPEDIDLELVERRMWHIRRFGAHPAALLLRQHTFLVEKLAAKDKAAPEVVLWCFHHDDHEGVIGDIIGPVESIIRKQTSVLDDLKDRLDSAICRRRSMRYPSIETKKTVYYYDKLAEALEWRYGLGEPDPLPEHPEWPAWLDDGLASRMFFWATQLGEGGERY